MYGENDPALFSQGDTYVDLCDQSLNGKCKYSTLLIDLLKLDRLIPQLRRGKMIRPIFASGHLGGPLQPEPERLV